MLIFLKKWVKKVTKNFFFLKSKKINQILENKDLKKVGAIKTVEQIILNYWPNKPLSFIYCEIANFLLNSGQPSLAQSYYKLSLKLAFIPFTYSLYLQCLVLDPFCSEEEMYQEALRYNQFFSRIKRYKFFPNNLNPDRILNIGYLCHFFHNSVSQSLLVPFLKAHNRQRVKVFCYSDAEPHEVPDWIKGSADKWLDTKALDDETLATVLREDQIDVLLELNGHCFLNRYGVIARKPSPVQISYYNQCGTTGVSAFDYVIAGDEMVLDRSRSFYTESLYYLKGVSGIAQFSDGFPECFPSPPCLKNDYITFGSFGAAHKVNAEVIKLWCQVLRLVPNSMFYMKAGALTHEAYKQAYENLFSAEGIDKDRVCLEGFSEHYKMLECYSKVDIALDTFPYAAGTTTMEASWQGVPVITLSGDSYCSQNGKGILTSIGHPELVAYSKEEFIQKAVELASDKERLIKYRQNLREDFRKSPRADAVTFATKLENAYQDMWVRYCKSAAQV